jgi:hypothetical protein
MPNTFVKNKMLVTPNRDGKSPWILLAEDAEKDAATAKLRSDRLCEAARIFRLNAETGEPWPGTQSADQTNESCHTS